MVSGPTTIVLVRHGETMGNRDRRYQTYDTPLSELGREQAARVAERLANDAPYSALYSSDLLRTRETAEAIGARLNLTPILTPRLRELDTGGFKGRAHADIEAETPGFIERWVTAGGRDRLPGEAGESVADVAARMQAQFDAIVAQHPGERVIAVSHGWAIAILLAHVHGWDHHEAFAARRAQLNNTAVSITEVDIAGSRTCTLLGCVTHLDESS